MSEDYPYNSDYTPPPQTSARPAPRAAELPRMVWNDPMDNYDPYDDGLNPARGILLGLLGSLALILIFCAVWAYFWS